MSGREFLNLEVDEMIEYLEGISSIWGLYGLGLSGIGIYNRLIKKLPQIQVLQLGWDGRREYVISDRKTKTKVKFVIKVTYKPGCDDVTVKVEGRISKTTK